MTNLVHKYAELQYTIPRATVATILHRAAADPHDQVTLIADEGGISATVTCRPDTTVPPKRQATRCLWLAPSCTAIPVSKVASRRPGGC